MNPVFNLSNVVAGTTANANVFLNSDVVFFIAQWEFREIESTVEVVRIGTDDDTIRLALNIDSNNDGTLTFKATGTYFSLPFNTIATRPAVNVVLTQATTYRIAVLFNTATGELINNVNGTQQSRQEDMRPWSQEAITRTALNNPFAAVDSDNILQLAAGYTQLPTPENIDAWVNNGELPSRFPAGFDTQATLTSVGANPAFSGLSVGDIIATDNTNFIPQADGTIDDSAAANDETANVLIFTASTSTLSNTITLRKVDAAQEPDNPPVLAFSDNYVDGQTVTLTTADTFTAPTATFTDDNDGTGSVAVTSNVDTSIAGTYQVSASYTDTGGNAVTIGFDVVVSEVASSVNLQPVLDQLATITGELSALSQVVDNLNTATGENTTAIQAIDLAPLAQSAAETATLLQTVDGKADNNAAQLAEIGNRVDETVTPSDIIPIAQGLTAIGENVALIPTNTVLSDDVRLDSIGVPVGEASISSDALQPLVDSIAEANTNSQNTLRHLRNKTVRTDAQGNMTAPAQAVREVLYADDGTTPIFVIEHRDAEGNPVAAFAASESVPV